MDQSLVIVVFESIWMWIDGNLGSLGFCGKCVAAFVLTPGMDSNR